MTGGLEGCQLLNSALWRDEAMNYFSAKFKKPDHVSWCCMILTDSAGMNSSDGRQPVKFETIQIE